MFLFSLQETQEQCGEQKGKREETSPDLDFFFFFYKPC